MDDSPILNSEGFFREDSPRVAMENVPTWDSLVVILYKVIALASQKKLFNNGRKKVVGRLVEIIQQVIPEVQIDLEEVVQKLDFAHVEGNLGGYIHNE